MSNTNEDAAPTPGAQARVARPQPGALDTREPQPGHGAAQHGWTDARPNEISSDGVRAVCNADAVAKWTPEKARATGRMISAISEHLREEERAQHAERTRLGIAAAKARRAARR